MSVRQPTYVSVIALLFMAINLCYAQRNVNSLPPDTVSKMACLAYEDYNYFDLRPLRDYPMQFKIDGDHYLYNPCQYIDLQTIGNQNCQDLDYNTFGVSANQSTSDCFAITDSDALPVDLIAITNKTDGIRNIEVVRNGTQTCEVKVPDDDGKDQVNVVSQTFTLEVQCDMNITQEPFIVSATKTECDTKLVIRHETGCSIIDANPFVRFATNWPWSFAFFLLVGGTYVNMFGSKYFNISIRLIFGWFVFFTLMTMAGSFGWLDVLDYKDGNAKNVSFCIFLIFINIVLGVLIGWLISLYDKVSLIALSIFNAFLLSTIIYDFFLSFTASMALLVTTITLLLFICILLPFWHADQMKIQGTAIAGAYAFVRGISMCVGGFPNEFQLFAWIIHDIRLQQPSGFYIYFGVFLIVFLLGQHTQRQKAKRRQLLSSADFSDNRIRLLYADI